MLSPTDMHSVQAAGGGVEQVGSRYVSSMALLIVCRAVKCVTQQPHRCATLPPPHHFPLDQHVTYLPTAV